MKYGNIPQENQPATCSQVDHNGFNPVWTQERYSYEHAFAFSAFKE